MICCHSFVSAHYFIYLCLILTKSDGQVYTNKTNQLPLVELKDHVTTFVCVFTVTLSPFGKRSPLE